MSTILVIGALGQIGSALVTRLKQHYPNQKVLASDIRQCSGFDKNFIYLDATDTVHLRGVIKHNNITEIYHLAAILSAAGEAKPLDTWDLNMKLWLSVLQIAAECKIAKVFFPSSIAVFGDRAPKIDTPQDAFLNPSTVYGMSKAAGEHWGQYYFERYGLDVRSLRYPGVIGYESLPGGGTTDYAVDIFHKAVNNQGFECFLKEDTRLPMLYIDDVIDATITVMDAPKQQIRNRTSYNIGGISISPKELAKCIQQRYPNFKVNYKPDYRQGIADKWPNSINSSAAIQDWGYQSNFDLEKLTDAMIKGLEDQKTLEKI